LECPICQHRDFLKRPNVVGDASGHRWRDSQSFVDSGEIVVHEVQRDHVAVVLQLFAETLVRRVKEFSNPTRHI
jgi:hypothetical protein